MEYLQTIIEFLIHFDKHLAVIINTYGAWAYLFLFLVIFAETGLVVTPFLPGDSLLFMTGAICAQGSLNVITVFIILAAAAILGDSLNYAIGKMVGPKVFKYEKARFFKKEYLDATHRFYEKHGPKTIVLARFIPMMRTFAPFVAGIGKMSYGRFFAYNVIGGMIWASIFIFGGFWFGGMPLIKNNFMLFTLFIIFLSMLPIIVKFLMHSLKNQAKTGAT